MHKQKNETTTSAHRTGLPNTLPDKANRIAKVTIILVQALLTGCALVMSYWARLPLLGTVGLGLLGVTAIVAELSPASCNVRFWRWSAAGAWACTLTVPLSFWVWPDEHFTLDGVLDRYFAMLAWLTAAIILPTSHRVVGATIKTRWRKLMITCAIAGNFVWLAAAYLENQWIAFHVGLLIAFALLTFCKSQFSLSATAIQAANTLILIAIGLPLTGLLFHPDHQVKMEPQVLKKYYCYRAAKGNRSAFEQWWNYFAGEYIQVELKLLLIDRNSPVPIRLRPNGRAKLVESEIVVNRKGFRGGEISERKGNAYRIVAIGESTTFGYTLNHDDKPWPELFAQMVRERLKPNRPVEVINAGIPGITLPENLNRFPDEILPLKPDMIICYHGINGFPLLDNALPPLRGKPPPKYRMRPLRLLAECEFNLKLIFYKQTQTAELFFKPPTFANLMETKYASAYKQLISTAKTNGIRLVIASFPMAVNRQSPPEVVDFFRSRHPTVYWYIQANVAHNQMVQEIVRPYPEVCFVDTRPHIDGEEAKYIDLMHLTQEGDRQLAENFFSGIRTVLETDLTSSPAASESPPAR